MNKPNGYDQASAGSDWTPIEVGGHKAVIKAVEEATSSTGKPMLKVAIDFDDNDAQPGYFMNQFKNDDREGKKWPYQAVQYILSEDRDGNCSRQFKSFITSVERSNSAQVSWGNKFADWFKGKKVGAVYGSVEEEYNGEVKMRTRLRWFCEYDKADPAQVPQPKYLNNSAPAQAYTPKAQYNEGFVAVDDVEGIPF